MDHVLYLMNGPIVLAMAIFDFTSTYDEDSKAVRRATGPVVFS